MSIKRIIGECDPFPFLYGAAYCNVADWTITCYPIGLHWLIRWIRPLILKVFFQEWQQNYLQLCYNAGYIRGRSCKLIKEEEARNGFKA